jgi:DAACS family dicarboxylate/amino acid:cation (Na+ or H+) symporter
MKVTVLFLAQLAGVDLTLAAVDDRLPGRLAAWHGGRAGRSLPFVVAVLATVGITQLIAIILGVDRLLDMSRTVVNVMGDLTATVYVAKKEGAKLQI